LTADDLDLTPRDSRLLSREVKGGLTLGQAADLRAD